MSRRILLTGATGTVGSAIVADLLSQPGYTVVTAGRRRPFMLDKPHEHFTVDLANPDAVEASARQLANGSFKAAVFAAGIDSRQGITDVDPGVFSRVMQVNCLSQLQLLRQLVATAETPHWPFTVVALSSDVLCEPQPRTAVYAASKAALEEALRHAAHEIALRLLLIRLSYVGMEMAETGETGITSRSVHPVPPVVARDAAAATLGFLKRANNLRCVEVWP